MTVAEEANADDRKLIKIYDALASTYAEAGLYAESEHEYRRALLLAKKTAGHQSLEYALLVASIAVLPTQIGNREPVIEQLRNAIAVSRRTGSLGELAVVRICLARILMEGKRYGEAESVLLDAQSGAATLKASDPVRLADLLNSLGLLRFDQGHYAESIDLCLESIRLFESAMGNEHPSLIAASNNLALSYLKLGRLNDAELTLKHAMAVCNKTLGDDHPTCGVLLEGYAVVLRKLHRDDEARAIAAKSREIDRASRTRNGVDTTISVTGLRTRSNNAP